MLHQFALEEKSDEKRYCHILLRLLRAARRLMDTIHYLHLYDRSWIHSLYLEYCEPNIYVLKGNVGGI